MKINKGNLFILERDNWTCKLCGVSTPRELRGTLHPQAPEFGHIVPVSRGGTDDPSNLRCECRHCNGTIKISFLDEELDFTKYPPVPVSLEAVLEATRRWRENHLAGCRTTEHREAISRGNKGKVRSESTRKQMSESAKSVVKTPEHRRNMSIAKTNPSEETREKIRLGRAKQVITEETKIKIRLAITGKKRSLETRKKMSLAQTETSKYRTRNLLGQFQ